MKPKYNPVHKKENRNVFCPHYGECLNYAVKRAWEYWGCTECKQSFNEEARPETKSAASDWRDFFDLPQRNYKES
jgi:ribosomal protein L37AE/L43A